MEQLEKTMKVKKLRCEHCSLRATFDRSPRSLIGRLWRWHITWCPGWKAYSNSLTEEERGELTAKYSL